MMRLITFLCCFSLTLKGYTQERFDSKYFEIDESGIVVLNEFFYEAVYANELELANELKVKFQIVINDHKEQRNFQHLSLKKRVRIQEQIIILYLALGEYNISDEEELILYKMVVEEDKPYQLLNHFRFHNLILSLISFNNRRGNYESSFQYVKRHLPYLEQPWKFIRCGTAADIYKSRIGLNLFITHKGLGKNKEAIKFAFKYLYDSNWNSFEEVIEVIKKEYTKKEIKMAFKALKDNIIVEKEIKNKRVFRRFRVHFLDFSFSFNNTFDVNDTKWEKETYKMVRQFSLFKHLKAAL